MAGDHSTPAELKRSPDWRILTPVELIATSEVFPMDQAAHILQLHHRSGARKGLADPRLACELVERGRLILVDPEQPRKRWTVSRTVLQAYMAGDPMPRRKRDLHGVA